MFCRNCGKEIPDNTEYCRYCGAQQPQKAASSPASQDTAPTKKSDDNIYGIIALVLAFIFPIGGLAMGIYAQTSKNPETHRFGVAATWISAAILLLSIIVAALAILAVFGFLTTFFGHHIYVSSTSISVLFNFLSAILGR
jgi:hypothetical protein